MQNTSDKLLKIEGVSGNWITTIGKMKTFKFTIEFKLALLQLVHQGCNSQEACNILGVSRQHLDRAYKLEPSLKETVRRAKFQSKRNLISTSLRDLSEGSTKREETIEAYEEEELPDGSIRKIKRTIRTRILPPDIKALKMLAYKYAQGEYFETIAKELNIDVRITGQDRSLTVDERKKLIADDTGKDIEVVDYTSVDSELSS